MKSLIFFVTLLLTVCNLDASNGEPEISVCTNACFGGSIVMEDAIMMLVTSDDGVINGITVKTQNAQVVVYTSGGCASTSCSVDLSSLPRATYDVEVTTSTGNGFSGTVVAGS